MLIFAKLRALFKAYHTDVLSKVTVCSLLQDGYTPLMWAAMGGHTDTVRGLLPSGAVVDLADKVSI